MDEHVPEPLKDLISPELLSKFDQLSIRNRKDKRVGKAKKFFLQIRERLNVVPSAPPAEMLDKLGMEANNTLKGILNIYPTLVTIVSLNFRRVKTHKILAGRRIRSASVYCTRICFGV